MSAEESFVAYKRYAINAARELKYSSDIRESIKNAKSEREIIRLMRKGRDSL